MTRESSGTPNSFSFPKSIRILNSAGFRKVYNEGLRTSGPFFAAFCLSVLRDAQEGPRLGLTVARTFGKAVKRNRAKRRIREIFRTRLNRIDARWDIVINPRRPALDAPHEELIREIERVIQRCERP